MASRARDPVRWFDRARTAGATVIRSLAMQMMDERVELKANLALPIVLGIFGAMIAAAGALIPHVPLMVRSILLGVAALLVFLLVVVAKRRLVMDRSGVTATTLFGETHLDWNEVDHYTFWSQDQQIAYAAGGQGGVIGILIAVIVIAAVRRARKNKGVNTSKFTMGALRLNAADGRKLVIDTRYRKVAPALERAFGEVHARLRARPTLDFSPFTLGHELAHAKKGTLALPEIEKVVAQGVRLNVHKRGKRFAWVRQPMRKVKNSLLLIEMMGERGLIVNPSPGMFVPTTTMATLTAASARHAALPGARVVVR